MNIRQLNTVNQLRLRLLEYSPAFQVSESLNCYYSHKFSNFFSYFHLNFIFRSYFYVYNIIFINNSKNFYLNNSITQISKILGVCAGRFNTRQVNFLKK